MRGRYTQFGYNWNRTEQFLDCALYSFRLYLILSDFRNLSIIFLVPQVTEDIFESDLSIFDDPNLSDYNLENIQQSAEFSCGDQYVSSTESSDSYSDDHDLRFVKLIFH